jgi:hypothetical protein
MATNELCEPHHTGHVMGLIAESKGESQTRRHSSAAHH